MFKTRLYAPLLKDIDSGKYPKLKEAFRHSSGSILNWVLEPYDKKIGTFNYYDVLIRMGDTPNQNYHYIDILVSRRFLDDALRFELILNDHLCFHNTHMRTLEEKIIFCTLIRKILAISLCDIQLDYHRIDIHGPDGIILNRGTECYERVHSKSTFKKYVQKLGLKNIYNYYDVLCDAFFGKIFENHECPYKELLTKKIEILGSEAHTFMSESVPNIINHRMGRAHGVVDGLIYNYDKSLGFWDKEETENIYFIPNDDLAHSYNINNNRRLDMYIDMIFYLIKHDFDIEYTLSNYEYYKKPKVLEHSNKYGSYVIYRPSKYNMYRHYHNVVPGMSKTISYLYNNSIDILYPNVRKKLLYSGFPMIMYEDNEHTKLDKEWLISNNSDIMFNPKALPHYYEREHDRCYNEETFGQEFQNSPLFTYKERIKITEYKIKFLELLYGKYGYDKTKHTDIQFKHFCKLIDEELPQPELARVFINR